METIDPISTGIQRAVDRHPTAHADNGADRRSLEQAVHVRRGLEVYSLDGVLLGNVEEFIIDATGNLTSFIVTRGTALGDELRVVMEWIQSVTRERIHLTIPAVDARMSGSRC